MAKKYTLEPAQFWEGKARYLYKPPNTALAAILVDTRLNAIVSDWTAKVLAVYAQDIMSRPSRKGNPVSQTLANTHADIMIGGHKKDRWVGEITVGVDYAGADQYGRHAFNPYQGSYALTTALYSVLPQRM